MSLVPTAGNPLGLLRPTNPDTLSQTDDETVAHSPILASFPPPNVVLSSPLPPSSPHSPPLLPLSAIDQLPPGAQKSRPPSVRASSVLSIHGGRTESGEKVRKWIAGGSTISEGDGTMPETAINLEDSYSYQWGTQSVANTDFPSTEGPNAAKLRKLYYRLFAAQIGAIPSKHALKADDRSLSRVNVDWVPPPGSAGDYRRYICHREEIHPSRVVMFSKTPRGEWLPLSDEQLFEEGGTGNTPEMPLKLVVELGAGGLEGVRYPIPVLIQGARSTGTMLHRTGSFIRSLIC